MFSFDYVKDFDPEVAKAMEDELGRQRNNLELIASENLVSEAVMAAMGSHLTNKYAEGYPGKRYYGGCQYVDVVENLAIERAKELFGCEYVNIQPHSGAQANMAVFFAVMNLGDTYMGMNLDHGGHLTHGSPVNMSGKNYHCVPYGVNDEDFRGGFSMNLFHLRYFETLARTEHYSKAAEILSITQPSLSYAISTLESELGIQLFEKRGRNIVLTKYGKAFYSNVKEILASLDNAVRDIKLVANGEGEINIGFLRTLGTDYVPTTVKNFLDLHPDKNIWFNFSCEHGLSVDLVRSLIDREYDMVFCSKLNNSPMVEFIPIATQELVVIVPKDHPLAVKDSVSLKETLDYPQIIFRHKSGLRHIIDDLFKSINAYPDILCEIEEDLVGAGFVSKGFGIMIAPKFDGLNYVDVKVLKLTQPSYKRYFYMAILKDVYHPPLIEEFKKYVIEQSNLNKEYRFG